MTSPQEPRDPWNHLYTARRRVIACATVIEEMLPFLPPDVPHEVLDFGLHLAPARLREALQTRVDEAGAACDVVLLGYGLCSMAIIGLQARNAHVVIPRTDDCIGIFLGSCAAYRDQARQEPGTYYLTKGWIEVGDTPFQEHKRLVEKFGEERARRLTRLVLKNYRRLAFINTGMADIERYREYARQTAASFDLRFEEIEGSPELVKKLVFGPWDSEFIVLEPGQTMRYEDFARTAP